MTAMTKPEKPDGTPAPVGGSARAETSTHVLVPGQWVEALRELARTTRVYQSVYLREVVAYLLERYREDAPPVEATPVPPMPEGETLVSVVFRITYTEMDDLRAISRRTRVRQSEYLREGIWAVLTKYKVAPEDAR